MYLLFLILIAIVLTVLIVGPIVWTVMCWVESDWRWPWDSSHGLNHRLENGDWFWKECGDQE